MNMPVSKFLLVTSAVAAVVALVPRLVAQVDETKDSAYHAAPDQTSSTRQDWQSDRSALSAPTTNSTATESTPPEPARTETVHPARSTDTPVVHVAGPDALARTAGKLRGAVIRDAQGNELGRVADFLVDVDSGQMKWVVLATGAGGNDLRLAPFASLQRRGGEKEFTTELTKDAVLQAPRITEEQLALERIPAKEGMLVCATRLRGREVVANDERIGRIEGVVADPAQPDTSVLLKPTRSAGTTDRLLLIPLTRLRLHGSRGNVTTDLTNTDFESATSGGLVSEVESTGNAVAANLNSAMTPPPGRSNPAVGATAPNGSMLTPTGQAAPMGETGSADPKLVAAAQAIRAALDNDPTVAHADVRVVPEHGHITLRGTVATRAQRESIQSKARQAAHGCPLDFQLEDATPGPK